MEKCILWQNDDLLGCRYVPDVMAPVEIFNCFDFKKNFLIELSEQAIIITIIINLFHVD